MKDWAVRKASEKSASKQAHTFIEIKKALGPHIQNYLGEAAFWAIYQGFKYTSCSSHDFSLENLKVEVKTFLYKKPLHWGKTNMFIPVVDAGRSEGTYYFVGIHESMERATLVGMIPVEKFDEAAVFRQRGSDRVGQKGIYECDCLELPDSSLLTQARYDVFKGICNNSNAASGSYRRNESGLILRRATANTLNFNSNKPTSPVIEPD